MTAELSAKTEDDTPPSRRFTIAFAVAMTIIAIGWVWVWQARTERLVIEPVPTMAVVGVDMPPGEETRELDFREQLAASLARVPQLTVTPPAELFGASMGDPSPAAQVEAARELGVPQVLQGTLTRTGAGYRLELQRLDAQTREEYGKVTAEGRTHARVIESIRAQLAMSLGLAIPE